MESAKEITVSAIAGADARRFVERWHYSKKTVNNSQLHFGAFNGKRLVGVMQYGPPMERRQTLRWHSRSIGRRFESRFIAITVRLIKKHYGNVEWLLSFSDACSCGDGTIYRASGFLLTGIKRNTGTIEAGGETFARMAVDTGSDVQRRLATLLGVPAIHSFGDAVRKGARVLPGHQLRYVLPLKPGVAARISVPILPFSAIAAAGAGMYLGKSRAGSIESDAPAFHAGEGGEVPTPALQPDEGT